MKKHFTLTEILVVVFLIGLLTTIGFGMYSYAMNSAKESATRALLKRLETALETCNTKLGYIPTTVEPTTVENGSNQPEFWMIRVEKNASDETIKSLKFRGKNGETVNADYLKEFLRTIDAENLKKNLQKESSDEHYILVDGWGNPICFAYPGKFNKTGYDLYSFGADGRMGSEAAKISFEEKKNGISDLNDSKPENFKDTETNEMLCDDICNF